jgi:hypothetical protein
MPEQQRRPVGEVVNEVAEQLHHIVVAGQAVGCRAAHPRQVRVDPPVSRAGNDGLDRRLDLTMINTGSVQSDQRHTGAVLDEVDRDSVDPALHTDTVMIGSDDSGCDEGGPVGGSSCGTPVSARAAPRRPARQPLLLPLSGFAAVRGHHRGLARGSAISAPGPVDRPTRAHLR